MSRDRLRDNDKRSEYDKIVLFSNGHSAVMQNRGVVDAKVRMMNRCAHGSHIFAPKLIKSENDIKSEKTVEIQSSRR